MPSPKPVPLPPPPQRGTWYPYSSSFESNMAMVLIILFCALLCALILKLSFYCITRRSSNTTTRQPQLESDDDDDTQKPNDTAPHPTLPPSPPTLLFYSGLKLAGAEAVCAICLSEFVDGEGIKVLPRCDHGFHVTCIQSWLSSHTSCPTCRTSSYVIDHEKKKQKTTTTATGGEETELARLDLEAQSRLPLPLTSQLPVL